MQIYVAGPLFSAAERAFNRALADAMLKLAPQFSIRLPQENTAQFVGRPDQNRAIYEDCLAGVRGADVVIAVLDGADVDSGTAVEIGYACANGVPVIGIRTDVRGSEERGVNLMVAFACRELVNDPEATPAALAARVVAFCRSTERATQGARSSA